MVDEKMQNLLSKEGQCYKMFKYVRVVLLKNSAGIVVTMSE